MSELIPSIIKQFQYYKSLGEKTFDQLSDEGLFWQHNPESNSIAIIVGHVHGNMLSRWTDFLKSDGEKKWRNRDQEFEKVIESRADLIARWNEGWACLLDALSDLKESDLQKEIFIRNMGQTAQEAINRQLAHYAYHIGQIVFIGVQVMGDQWKSLSIPKGDSIKYNQEKFSQEKRAEHYTDDL